MNTITPFYKFRAEAGEEPASAELLIFDVIGDWEDLGEIGAKAFARDLSGLPKSIKRIDIHINSPGGSVSEANAIYSRLADHRSDKHVYVDGIAASAATLIAMVGHKIYIRANATMMIHLPMAIGIGNADDMRTVAAALDSVTESMLNLYTKRTGQERESIRSLMSAETWFSAQQAVDKGFADEVRGVVKAAAVVGEKRVMFNGCTFDLSRFHNVPVFTGQQESTTHMNNATQPTAENNAPATTETPPPDETSNAAATETPTPPTKPKPKPTPPPPEPPGDAATTTVTDYDKGVKAERDRIAALQKYDKPSTHAIVTKAIAEGKTVADITDELFTAIENSGQQTARRSDAQSLDGIPPVSATVGDEGNNDFGALLTRKVKSCLKSRGRRSALHSRN
jgi:ATP-dependent protease ClpP protease subunit